MDKKQSDAGTAASSHVVGFDTMELADQAYLNVTRRNKETYTQVEALKLYGGLP
jgi:hypothetical protein